MPLCSLLITMNQNPNVLSDIQKKAIAVNQVSKFQNDLLVSWILPKKRMIKFDLTTIELGNKELFGHHKIVKLFLNAKKSLSLWSKWQIGHGKWFFNTNLFPIKPFLIAKFDCTMIPDVDLFIFRKNLKTPKRHFEMNWPLKFL